MNKIVSDILSVFKSKIFIILLGLGKSILIARTMGPSLNGQLSLLLVYPTLFIAFGSLGIRKSSAYFIGTNSYTNERIETAVSQLWLFASILSLFIVYFLLHFSLKQSNNLLILLTISSLPFNLANNYVSGFYLGNNDIKGFNKTQWVPYFVTFLSIIVFVVLLKYSLIGALISEFLGPFVMTVYLFGKYNLIKKLSFRIDVLIIKSLLILGIGYAASLFITNLNFQINILLLKKFSNTYEIGIYTKGAGLIQYLWQIPLLLGTIVFARATRVKDRFAFSLKVVLLLRISLVVVTIVSIFFMFFSKEIILLLFGSAFIESYIVVIFLAPGVVLLTIFKVLNMDISGRGKPWVSFLTFLPAIFFNLVLSYFLIPKFGAKGSAVASTLSYSLAALLFLFIYLRIVKISFKDVFKFSKNDFDILRSYLS